MRVTSGKSRVRESRLPGSISEGGAEWPSYSTANGALKELTTIP